MAYAHGLISNPQPPAIYAERELEWDDLPALMEHRGVGGKRLQNIRSIHHKIARMMAAGCANVEIAAATGMHHNYLTVLRGDPAFQELLAHYEENEKELFYNVRERAAQLGMTAAEVLQQRLLEEPDRIPTKDLMTIMQGGFDYGGHKPAERSENLHVHTTREEIDKIKQSRSENVSVRGGPGGDDGSAGDVIDGEYAEAESGVEVREEGSEGDREVDESDSESLAGLLGF